MKLKYQHFMKTILLLAISISPLIAPQAPAAGLMCSKVFREFDISKPLNDLTKKKVVFKSPLAISSYLEIVSQNIYINSAGQEVGYSFIFRPIKSHIEELKQNRGGLKPYRTEIDKNNRSLFEALGFKEGTDPVYGEYMQEVPDPRLFEYLRAKYNARVEPDMQINVGIYQSEVVSAHQTEILKFWIKDATMAIGKPQLGSVLGKTPTEIADTIMKNGQELNSIYRHDLEHFASIMLVPRKVVDYNRHLSKFWDKVLGRVRDDVRAGRLSKDSELYRSTLDSIYVFVRRFHSLTHVLGMLARANGSIDVNKQQLTDFGDVARKETPTVHWTGLGYRPTWVTKADLPFESRLLTLGLENSVVTDKPVTIARAFDAVTNDGLKQIRKFIENEKDPKQREFYEQTLHEVLLDKVQPLNQKQLQDLQNLTLKRYHEMGN